MVVVESSRDRTGIVGSASAPYINNTLLPGADDFTNATTFLSPSQPNLIEMFAGDNLGVTSNDCPIDKSAYSNLGSQLSGAGHTFVGYSEDLPATGSTVCTSGEYMRAHNPWVTFGLPAATNQPFTAFPSDFSQLPTISFVIPNKCHDMLGEPYSGCTAFFTDLVKDGDDWLKANLGSFATFAKAHNDLLIVTWDQPTPSGGPTYPTLFIGAAVAGGQFSEAINHRRVLATIEAMYGLPTLRGADTAITDVWKGGAVTVTDPGDQRTEVGSAVNVPITATDSFATTLTYSAAGLPSGLSIDPATGVISGNATTAASSEVTVTAQDPNGTSGAAAFVWAVTMPGSAEGTPTTTTHPPTTTPPPTNATPTVPVTTEPPPPTADAVISLPPASKCVRGPRLTLRLHKPAAVAITSARITINGHARPLLKGRRLRGAIRLDKLPTRGTITVRVSVRLASGGRLTLSRRFHSCRS